jgi:hypothetical protein
MEAGSMTHDKELEILAEFAQAEQDGTAEKAIIVLGPFTLYTLISAVQLACRNPGMGDQLRERLTAVTGQMMENFPDGSIIRELLEQGNDPSQDVIEGEVMQVPYRTDKTRMLRCPACSNDMWIAGPDPEDRSVNRFQCYECKTIYSRDAMNRILAEAQGYMS